MCLPDFHVDGFALCALRNWKCNVKFHRDGICKSSYKWGCVSAAVEQVVRYERLTVLLSVCTATEIRARKVSDCGRILNGLVCAPL